MISLRGFRSRAFVLLSLSGRFRLSALLGLTLRGLALQSLQSLSLQTCQTQTLCLLFTDALCLAFGELRLQLFFPRGALEIA